MHRSQHQRSRALMSQGEGTADVRCASAEGRPGSWAEIKPSSFWLSGLAHAVKEAVGLLPHGRIIALRAHQKAAQAGDGEFRLDREAGLSGGASVVFPAEMGQSGGEIDMRVGHIPEIFD